MLPSITEYIESILLSKNSFRSLKLSPIKDGGGRPGFVTGNFAVTFKMKDADTEGLKAVKCYTRLQAERARRLEMLSTFFREHADRDLIVKFEYISEELWVESQQSEESEFPVLLMDWTGEMTLGQYVSQLCSAESKERLKELAHKFDEFAARLLKTNFAHGDLKHDNIVINRNPLRFVLIDVDGIFIPEMKGWEGLENGSPGFRHPRRTKAYFNASIDDFPILVLSLSLHLLAEHPHLHALFCHGDNILFSQSDLRNPGQSSLLASLSSLQLSKACWSRLRLLLRALRLPPGPIVRLPALLHPAADKTPKVPLQYSGRYELLSPFSEGLAMVGNMDFLSNRYRYGFIDETGRENIALQFTQAKHFKEGLAAVKQSKWGYIDYEGNMVISPQFEAANSFTNGYAQVKKNGKWGFLQPDGTLFLACIYDKTKPFLDGVFEVKLNGRWTQLVKEE